MFNDFLSVFLQKFLEIVIPVLATLVAGYVAVGIRKLIEEIKANLNEKQLALATEIVHEAVLAAEQVGLGDALIDKKDYALDLAEQWLASHGIKLDLKILDNLIEAAVMDEFNRDKAPLIEVEGEG